MYARYNLISRPLPLVHCTWSWCVAPGWSRLLFAPVYTCSCALWATERAIGTFVGSAPHFRATIFH